MRWIDRFVLRIRSVFRRARVEQELDAELRFHVEQQIEENVAAGMSHDGARSAALRSAGSITQIKEECRDSLGLRLVDELGQDIRYGLRQFRQAPGFSAVAVIMLALAIGLNATVFTVMDAMLFRGFPLVKRNDRLMYLRQHYPTGAEGISYGDVEDWRAATQAFEGIAFAGLARSISLRDDDGRSIDTFATPVSTNTFGLLGLQPVIGRDFVLAEEAAGAAPVAILNYRFWKNHFGERTDIVGLTVQINRASATIIGVMPEGFDFPMQGDLWMPVVHNPGVEQRGITAPQGFTAVARVRDGVSLEAARTELETINRRMAEAYPATNRGVTAASVTHSTMMSGPDAPIIWGSLWAGAWIVLLIACGNLATLTLVRTVGRWREFSTRMALGAGPARLLRQVFVESAILTSVAGVLGWWITRRSVHTWAVATASPYQILDYTVSSATLVYLVAISVLAAILCTLAPISRVMRLAANGALKGDARGITQGLHGKRLAIRLVAGQMALAVVLLSGAGVLVRSLLTIVNAETGVRDPEHVLVGSMRLPSEKYPAARRFAYFDRVEDQLKATPGIRETSVASSIPVSMTFTWPFEIEGRPIPRDTEERAEFLWTKSGYFRVLGVSAISGRDFNDGDHASALRVAIVNQAFANRYWPGEQALGKRFRFVVSENEPGGEWKVVVGIVPNIMQGEGIRQQFRPVIYLPFWQQPTPTRRAFFLARTGVPPNDIAPTIRTGLRELDSDVLLEDFGTLKASFGFDRDSMDAGHSELGKHAAVAPIFALLALMIAAVGLYAVIARVVRQRTQEIGVRIALGATSHDISRLIFGEGMRPVAVGLIVGLTASVGFNRILQSQLVGVSPYDPVTLAGVPVILIVVALLACHIPARRATKVDPMVALRCE